MKDIHNNVTTSVALSPQVIATDTTTVGAIIDTRDTDGLEFIIASGTVTDGAYAILIETGDVANLSDAAAVADAMLLGTEADAGFALTDDDTTKTIGVKHDNKRYARLSVVSTATTTGGLFSAVAVQVPLVK